MNQDLVNILERIARKYNLNILPKNGAGKNYRDLCWLDPPYSHSVYLVVDEDSTRFKLTIYVTRNEEAIQYFARRSEDIKNEIRNKIGYPLEVHLNSRSTVFRIIFHKEIENDYSSIEKWLDDYVPVLKEIAQKYTEEGILNGELNPFQR